MVGIKQLKIFLIRGKHIHKIKKDIKLVGLWNIKTDGREKHLPICTLLWTNKFKKKSYLFILKKHLPVTNPGNTSCSYSAQLPAARGKGNFPHWSQEKITTALINQIFRFPAVEQNLLKIPNSSISFSLSQWEALCLTAFHELCGKLIPRWERLKASFSQELFPTMKHNIARNYMYNLQEK